jgi:hypothetical protein
MERPRTHPILLAAGVAVLLFSLLGAAALTGLMPAGNSNPGEFGALAQKTAAATFAAHPSPRIAAAPCANCGVIESVRAPEVKRRGRESGAAAGGAVAGHEVERHLSRHTVWYVVVRLEDGGVRTLSQRTPPPHAVGDRVRIVGGAVERA